jgi:hypothetical protein
MKTFAALLLVVAIVSGQEEEGVKIGSLTTKQHGVKGDVYAIDEKTILVKNFEYDGQGPDAFFWVGTSERPGSVGTILAHPFEGKFYEYEDQDAPVLKGQFDGSKDIKLTLPASLNVSDLKWFSVWCRQFSVNFGDLIFPENFSLDKTVETTTSTTTTTTDLPPPLVHHDNTIDDTVNPDEDNDVKPEPNDQEHDHHQPRRGAASNVVSSSTGLIISYFVAKFLL